MLKLDETSMLAFNDGVNIILSVFIRADDGHEHFELSN